MSERLTSSNAAAVGHVGRPADIFSNVVTQVMGDHPAPPRRFTRADAEVHGATPPAKRWFTQTCLQILSTRTPEYGFTNVILPDVFPDDISYNSVGSTRFATDVIVVDSGDDQRVSRWDQPIMEFDVAYGVRTMEQLTHLITFFRAMRGRFYAFNYRDHVDYTSSVASAYEARVAPPVKSSDQLIAIGDGVKYQFQLTKTYASSTQSQVRTISRPEPGTVLVEVDGALSSLWTVDTDSGFVTFTTPLSETFTHPLTLGALSSGSGTISGNVGDFNAYKPFVGRGIIISGFTTNVNNVPIDKGAILAAVSSDGSAMTVNYPLNYGTHPEASTNVRLDVHPAPPVNAVIKAGFQFFVPCRFDTDILPVTLEDYGIGSSNSVKLIEVRQSAF